MPYSHVELLALLRALRDNDKPILLGKQVLADQGTGVSGASEWSLAGDIAGASDTNASFPVRYGFDRRLDIPTTHVTISSTHYLIYDMGAAATQEIEFDSVVISGHNFKGEDVTVSLMLSDDGDFTGTGLNVVTIATFVLTAAAGTDARLVSTALDHLAASQRLYSNVRFVALKMVYTSGATRTQIGQLWLAKRLQLEHQFKYPHPFKQRRTKKKVFKSDDDHKTKVILASQQFVLPGQKTNIVATTAQPGLVNDVENFLDDIDWGGKAFHYIEEPFTLPQQAPLMSTEADPSFFEIEAGRHFLTIDALEDAPLSQSEV